MPRRFTSVDDGNESGLRFSRHRTPRGCSRRRLYGGGRLCDSPVCNRRPWPSCLRGRRGFPSFGALLRCRFSNTAAAPVDTSSTHCKKLATRLWSPALNVEGRDSRSCSPHPHFIFPVPVGAHRLQPARLRAAAGRPVESGTCSTRVRLTPMTTTAVIPQAAVILTVTAT
jgi:hypothetical protein